MHDVTMIISALVSRPNLRINCKEKIEVIQGPTLILRSNKGRRIVFKWERLGLHLRKIQVLLKKDQGLKLGRDMKVHCLAGIHLAILRSQIKGWN